MPIYCFIVQEFFFKKIKKFKEVFKNMKCCTILWWYASYLTSIVHKRIITRLTINHKWLQMQFGLNKQCKRDNTTLNRHYYKSSSPKKSFSFPGSHSDSLQENPYFDHRLAGIRNHLLQFSNQFSSSTGLTY